MKKILSSFPRWISIFALAALILLMYLITNHFQIFESANIPTIFGEDKIPCLEFTFWIYLSIFIYVPFILFILPRQYFISFSVILLYVSLGYLIFFVLYPTTYPRHDKQWSDIALWILNIDMPNNAFPSLHVFLATFIALGYMYIQPNWKGLLVLLWATLICISTLTTKQHYLLDIIASIVVSMIASIYLYHKKLPRD